MFFEQIFEEKLAQYAYLIGCQQNGEAIVIDPMRDIERYEELAAKHNLTIVAAAETHIHADYLSGVREFAAKGAKVYVSDEGDADWKYEWVLNGDYKHHLLKDGDTFSIGNIKFRAIHTPGHTPEHMIYEVTDGATTDEPMGLISGDFVFVGDVGRPDLLETAAGQVGSMEDSAKVMYNSVKKFKDFPEYLQLWPGHGAGSACGKALGAVPESTVGYEQRFNNSIKAAITEQDFVRFILDGQPEPPLYFARMKRDNKLGPKVLGTLPNPVKISLQKLIDAKQSNNSVVVDTRLDREEYMRFHLEGSIYAPLNKSFNTVVGSYVTEEKDIYLIIDEENVREAVVDLVRIGLDNVKGFVNPSELEAYQKEGGNVASIESINFEQVDELLQDDDYLVLDVRKKSEFDEGHLPGAINIAHTRLLDRIVEVPTDKTLLVHCKSGARSSAAVSLLEQHGFSIKYVYDLVEPYLEEKKLVLETK